MTSRGNSTKDDYRQRDPRTAETRTRPIQERTHTYLILGDEDDDEDEEYTERGSDRKEQPTNQHAIERNASKATTERITVSV